MKIDKSQIKAIFEFSPQDYILVYSDDRKMGKEWSLNYLIDRSEKGKSPDVGAPAIYLSGEEAEQLKKNGFSWMDAP